ncbi:threonine ammonia-lyase [Pararhodobacter marinus]|uniref:threonine ammonia-lyase n=1 Tax=Pararhodobacter marinus TaxID=2184063 RepID=UPI003511098F
MTDIHMIDAAAGRLSGHARRTPLLSSPFLDEIAGRPVFVKAECLQHTGSFKFRGAWNAISALREAGESKGIIAFSSGNHAQGVALAARLQGLPSVIVMPADAPAIKIENTRALGAEVVPYDRATEDRDEIGARLARERGLSLVKPFDMAEVIAGQGTSGLEIAEQAAEAGIDRAQVLVPCGGGGLTSGIALALEARAPGFTVHPVEPEGFDDVLRSQKAGTRQRNERLSGSICDAIITPTPGDLTWPVIQRLCGEGFAVSEDEALKAMALAFDRLKIVLEPGGAVALAAALFRPGEGSVIAVASGGNVDRAMMARALSQ